ncbi:MAG TPA: type II toxin-antitoxin system VapC family toxin [Gemmataceae bacterium]|nr:type II toxin-antitoxin system VapC family toxin [Gemmataceae bacterium]
MNLLDTDILTLLMNGHALVTRRVSQADEPRITIISRIEILQGRFASILKAAVAHELLRAQDRLERTELFLQAQSIAFFDQMAAAEFEKLRQIPKLRKIGRADLMIACIAIARRATVITRNLKHFRLIPGLQVENWAD